MIRLDKEDDMLTVTIAINGRLIYARTAVNVTARRSVTDAATRGDVYEADDGTTLRHFPQNGAVSLAIDLLGLIHEVDAEDIIATPSPTKLGHE